MGHPWPLFDLRLRTPRLELRLPTDDDLLALLRVARAGVHEAEITPFLVAWDELPSPAFERNFLTYHWRGRGTWDPAAWGVNFAAVEDGRPVGMQEMHARDFGVRRVVGSGSWLGREYQRRGLGTEMRAAILTLAFDGLGADAAESGWIEGNEASRRVSRKLGYVDNGIQTVAPGGRAMIEHVVRVTRDSWRRELVPVTIEGLEPCLPLFGAGPLGPDDWARP